METIVHFSHKQHPLALRDEAENEEQMLYTCSICELPMLSSPSYTCTSKDCKFLVHKPCAHMLPYKLKHPRDPYGHSLSLRENPHVGGPHDCRICLKPCRNFTYACEACEINLHPLCARPVEIKSKHESHYEHPLVAICREMLTVCNACGDEHFGFFFFCQECNFWIHRDCALLPSIVKPVSHPHPLIRTYTLNNVWLGSKDCSICGKKLLADGIYSCAQCGIDYTAHVSCATSNMENLTCETGQELIIQMPDEGTTFPSLIIRILEKRKRIVKDDYDDDKDKLTIEEYHNHPLVFHDNTKHENQSRSSTKEACLVQELVTTCDACIRPINISSPFWGCTRPDCHFSLHNFCKANIPFKIDSEYCASEPFVLRPAAHPTNTFFHSVFPCDLCHRPCNGFFYHKDEFLCDLECISSPVTIAHASHGQHHVLFKQKNPIFRSTRVHAMRCCSDNNKCYIVYGCVSCDFIIHIGCALLPRKVRHKFDKHDLELMFDWVEKECCFCEFCEEDIDQQHWFYHCADCDQSFHIKCIPSVGRLSKVKFGGTLVVSYCHPRHPVALTRMLMESNQRCGYCKDIIPGFVDEMAFYCSDCEFWIHFGCARDCCAANDDSEFGRPQLWYEYKHRFSDPPH